MRHCGFLRGLTFLCFFSILCSTPCAARNRPRKFRQSRRKKMESSKLFSFIKQDVVPAASGCLAFYSTLGLSTCAQKMVGVSTGTKVFARAAGVPTVCLAALASHRCTLLAQEWSRNPEVIRDGKSSMRILTTSPSREDCYEIAPNIRLPKQEVHM